MKRKDIRIGMKVVPFRKSIRYTTKWGVHEVKDKVNNLDTSFVWRKAQEKGQKFLMVMAFDSEKGIKYVELADKEGVGEGVGADFFLPSDFKPYESK